ncbi:Protein NUCLEAR FUSION DEFECTIVE 4, partial [Linum perenne]
PDLKSAHHISTTTAVFFIGKLSAESAGGIPPLSAGRRSRSFNFMAGQSRKWMILVATIWIQAFTGTNFDFSAYSSQLKSVLGISQVELNYLAVASDLGKVFGWSSGLALMYFPLWSVLFAAAFMGLLGYGLQWMVIQNLISLPYCLVFILCLMAGCSICWFNTVCFVLCIKNFPSNRSLALSLTVSFNGVSAALYTLAANSIDSSSDEVYLLLNALVPLIVSILALVPILRQPTLDPLPPDGLSRDSLVFVILFFLAILNGIYLLLFGSNTADGTIAHLRLGGAIFLLILPLCIPGVVIARQWFRQAINNTNFQLAEGSKFMLVDVDELELHRELMNTENGAKGKDSSAPVQKNPGESDDEKVSCLNAVVEKDKLAMLGEEHTAWLLVRRVDFWLYFFAYFCGGTIGLVYSNNLGQIAQSLGQVSKTTTLVTVYSAFSFFGRLLSAAPDFMRGKLYFARTAWLTIALLPTPIAFFLLAASSDKMTLYIATGLVGLSSGFIFAAAVSITSELFGPNSVSVNHNILITNIPIGSLLYGCLAAMVYDANAKSSGSGVSWTMNRPDSLVCMGKDCYFLTFLWWGGLSIVGLVSSMLLFLRTRHAYNQFEQKRS